MKNHSREFRDILDSSNVQKKLRNIKDDTDKNLCCVLSISKEDIEELRKIINKNKINAGKNGINNGIPAGEIKFKGNIIPIDLIFDRVSWLKNAYESALNSTDKDKELEAANDKLISTIFMLLDEENKKNQEKKEAKDKALERKKYEDAEHSLKHKLLEQKGRGIAIELTDKYEIIARLNTIGVGDKITFKDGYAVIIVGKRSGTIDGKNVKVRFEGTPSLSTEGHKRIEGEWWNLDNLLKISGTTIDDIRQLNIPPQLGGKPNKPNKPEKPNKPVHYQELPAKIMDYFPNKSCKINTIHNELVKNNDIFVNLGLGRYGLKEWGYEGGVVKDILVRIFEKNDRPMTVKELCKEVLKEKMVSPNTVMLNLQKYKDTFERVDKGVYQMKK